jgi:predicted Zn-dependent protease
MVYINSFIASTLLLALFNGSTGFSHYAQSSDSRIRTSLNAQSSSALYYRQSSDANYAPSTLLHASSSTIIEPISSDRDIESLIEAALNNARDMDRQFGLCTTQSIRAWKIVDELYMMSSASQEVEDCVKNALGSEKSVWSLFE